jgi:hypothetical protein
VCVCLEMNSTSGGDKVVNVCGSHGTAALHLLASLPLLHPLPLPLLLMTSTLQQKTLYLLLFA